MSIIKKYANVVIPGLLLAMSFSVFSHHSGSEYDRSTVTEFEGEVRAVSWRNPHVLIDVATVDARGEETIWHMEGSAVSAQRRQGVEAGLIKIGQKVRIAGWPSTRRDSYMHVNHVLLPDSVELLVGSIREPRWSETSQGKERWMGMAASTEASGNTVVDDAEGIYRVWIRGTGTWYFRNSDAYQLTESALLAKANWNEFEDNPLLDCTPPGMPGLMGNPYPMQFVQVDGNIELRFEEFDVIRTIHIDDATNAADQPLSPLGYSVGHWEDGTLVVKTNRINWPYFDRVGVPQSEAVELLEQFTAVNVENEIRLIYKLTVTDPATLIEPFVWNAFYESRAGEVVERYECTLDE